MNSEKQNTTQSKSLLRRITPDAVAVVLFVLVSVAYFFTPITQGLVLSGNDVTGGVGAGRERMEYLERTGNDTRWTNALFSGMPTYQISPSYKSRSVLSGLERVYELGLTDCAMYVFILLLGFYILMRTFRARPPVAVFGAVAWAFSSYFFIIIGAGHLWKVLTLAFIPPTIAGMVLCYRGKYLWGRCDDHVLHCVADFVEPFADDILLYLCNGAYFRRFPYYGNKRKATCALCEGCGNFRSGFADWRSR